MDSETKNKISKSLSGRKTSSGMLGNTHTAESKEKIAASQIGKMKNSPRSIYAWINTPAGNEILFGPLLYECTKFGLNLDYVSNLCKGKKKSYKGWSFNRLATNEERYNKIESLRVQGLMI